MHARSGGKNAQAKYARLGTSRKTEEMEVGEESSNIGGRFLDVESSEMGPVTAAGLVSKSKCGETQGTIDRRRKATPVARTPSSYTSAKYEPAPGQRLATSC